MNSPPNGRKGKFLKSIQRREKNNCCYKGAVKRLTTDLSVEMMEAKKTVAWHILSVIRK